MSRSLKRALTLALMLNSLIVCSLPSSFFSMYVGRRISSESRFLKSCLEVCVCKSEVGGEGKVELGFSDRQRSLPGASKQRFWEVLRFEISYLI